MTPLTLLAFLAGLLLLVFSMLTGVERPARAPARMAGAADGRASASSLVPMTGAFLAAFGATGYLLVRYTVLGPLTLLLVAAVAGALGALGALGLVAKWAVPGALADPIDERYLLQGHFAIVTTAIGVGTVGAIRYDDGGTSRAVPARTVDGAPLSSETEVVIDRIVDGVAYVEPWSLVEQRI